MNKKLYAGEIEKKQTFGVRDIFLASHKHE
jgi:hypothetical protein